MRVLCGTQGKQQHVLYYLGLVVFLLIAEVIASGGLKWVRVVVPRYCVPGETAYLYCEYNLGNHTLYAVKWYKDHEEFYRFVEKGNPRSRSYTVEGVTVDLKDSNAKRVVLRSVSYQTSGVFRCEVSAEAPSFMSAQSEARLEVVSFPEEDPQISGVEMQYQIGEEINLNCTSGKSYPASVLHWYINEQQVPKSKALIRYSVIEHEHGLVSTLLGLRFKLTERHFLGGSMRVKCIASLAPFILDDERESVVQSLAVKDYREAQLLVRSSASKISLPLAVILILLKLTNM